MGKRSGHWIHGACLEGHNYPTLPLVNGASSYPILTNMSNVERWARGVSFEESNVENPYETIDIADHDVDSESECATVTPFKTTLEAPPRTTAYRGYYGNIVSLAADFGSALFTSDVFADQPHNSPSHVECLQFQNFLHPMVCSTSP